MRDCLSNLLRREPVAERVRVIGDKTAQFEPAAFFLIHLRDAVRFVLGEVAPRVVAADRDESPRSAFRMLQDDVAR